MADPNWDSGEQFRVDAKPETGYWTKILDYVDASKRLKFVVQKRRPVANAPQGAAAPPAAAPPAAVGPVADQAVAQTEPNEWAYTPLNAPRKSCTADGDPRAPINPANCLLPDAPAGALIAKIGGSTAGKADGSKLFVVGKFCVFDLDERTKGPLYLTMNADPMGPVDRDGHLIVEIHRSV